MCVSALLWQIGVAGGKIDATMVEQDPKAGLFMLGVDMCPWLCSFIVVHRFLLFFVFSQVPPLFDEEEEEEWLDELRRKKSKCHDMNLDSIPGQSLKIDQIARFASLTSPATSTGRLAHH